ncbi:MAG: thrombospondin type 3 repeat-containing protein [Deltaproteobacteria bacterium]|nr:thrombospondin type 3 repeat-containing protein [Deltaproteobacteria bacterium]
MIRAFRLTILLTLGALAIVPTLEAQPCAPVTLANGSGAGSLPAIAKTGCSPITFGSALDGKTITVPETVELDTGIELVGGGKITLSGTAITSANAPVLRLKGSGNLVKDLKITHPGKTAMVVVGSANEIRSIQCDTANIGLWISGTFGSNGNLVSKSTFVNMTSKAIYLGPNNTGNKGLAAPKNLTASTINSSTWELSGSVTPGVTMVEIFGADAANAAVPQGKTYYLSSQQINNGIFVAHLDMATFNPTLPVTATAIDNDGNTSPFATVIKPLESSDFGTDGDGDSVADFIDNCPNKANIDQSNSDDDGFGDACDLCPNVSDPDQADLDGDGVGEACDNDIDGDGVLNGADNCPLVDNGNQKDADGDGVGDACEAGSNGNGTTDADSDGIPDTLDNCPAMANPNQEDSNGDGIGNACDSDTDGDGLVNGSDNCPFVENPDQDDLDGDGLGDACDPEDETTDTDGDGIADVDDNCPTVFNADHNDADGDGLGDPCDPDDDNDGIPDIVEGDDDMDNDGFPNRLDLDSNGDGILDADQKEDSNNDGIIDFLQPDIVPLPGTRGCTLIMRQ